VQETQLDRISPNVQPTGSGPDCAAGNNRLSVNAIVKPPDGRAYKTRATSMATVRPRRRAPDNHSV